MKQTNKQKKKQGRWLFFPSYSIAIRLNCLGFSFLFMRGRGLSWHETRSFRYIPVSVACSWQPLLPVNCINLLCIPESKPQQVLWQKENSGWQRRERGGKAKLATPLSFTCSPEAENSVTEIDGAARTTHQRTRTHCACIPDPHHLAPPRGKACLQKV